MTIFRKGLVLALVPLIFQLGFGLVFRWQHHQEATAENWHSHTKEVIGETQTLLRSLAESRASQRGFLITSLPIQDEYFRKSTRALQESMTRLRLLVGDNAGQARLLNEIDERLDPLLQELRDNQQRLRDGQVDKVLAWMKDEQGQQRFLDIRQDFDRFLEGEAQLDRERTLERDRWRFVGKSLYLAMITASIVLALVFLKLFSRVVSARIGSLKVSIDRIATGQPLPAPIAGNDELSSLDTGIRELAKNVTRVSELNAVVDTLRISEDRFRSLSLSAPIGIFQCDENGRTSFFNGECERILGMTAEQAATRVWVDALHPDDREEAVRTWDAFLKSGSRYAREWRYIVHGQLVWTLIAAKTIYKPDGSIQGFIGTVSDITARVMADARVQTQLARLRLLNDIAQAVAERQDMDSIFRVVLAQLEDNLPIDFDCVCSFDALKQTLKVLAVGANSEAAAGALRLTEGTVFPVPENGLGACVRGHNVYEPDLRKLEAPLARQFAAQGLLSLAAAPLARHGNTFGMILIARRPVSGFSSSDCEFLRQLSEQVFLAAQHSQLFNDLQAAYEELRFSQKTILQHERLRALGQMASGIAHDINNAISPITIYTESLLETEKNLSERARDYLETIQRAIDDVSATVGRIRDFYRARDEFAPFESVDLNALANHAIHLTRAKWKDIPQNRGVLIELSTEFEEGMPAVLGTENEIREALTNLVFNAVDAMPDGGVLTLATKLCRPAGAPAGPHTHAAIEVRDTGGGMDDETRRKCLEPFFTTKGERGTGLGLAMVYGTMQRHSGDIEIETRPGAGTVMRLMFPIPGLITHTKPPADSTIVVSRKLRILNVDDDPLIRKSLQDFLKLDGHEIASAEGGREGIELFASEYEKNRGFDLVITDLGMPVVDGKMVAKAVKEKDPKAAVILLTGWGQRMKTKGELPPYVDMVLSKPPKLRELREAIAAVTEGESHE